MLQTKRVGHTGIAAAGAAAASGAAAVASGAAAGASAASVGASVSVSVWGGAAVSAGASVSVGGCSIGSLLSAMLSCCLSVCMSVCQPFSVALALPWFSCSVLLNVSPLSLRFPSPLLSVSSSPWLSAQRRSTVGVARPAPTNLKIK